MRATIDIENITKQLIGMYLPKRLLLFGSQAQGSAEINSDIDLCVVMNTNDKRTLLTEMYMRIEADRPFDLLLYTPDEWESCLLDKTSFAYKINREGMLLYG
ncbi:MAG: nucleotidyltransferase domain-containing protein [Clostridiales bacterium]|jgi:predicted nucleotidyltransferase|nr:nucleotidyltransferase domain-containing protein [Clostridiales bacterium]